MKHSILFFISLIFLMSCESKKDKKTDSNLNENKYASIKDEVVVFDSLAPVNIKYSDSIATWKGYYKVLDNLKALKKTSPNEVLHLSDELVKNVELLRDSVTVKELDTKGMRARMNTLYNQSLRLQEMKDIPAISVSEVIDQTRGVFVIFRMIGDKINAIYDQKDFEKELIEDDFFFSKLDSIK